MKYIVKTEFHHGDIIIAYNRKTGAIMWQNLYTFLTLSNGEVAMHVTTQN